MTATVWILGDQLLEQHPALLAVEEKFNREKVVILIIESQAQLSRLPYHAQKLTLLISAMRHYAEILRSNGYRLDYRKAPTTIKALTEHCQKFNPKKLFTMSASSCRGNKFQRHLSKKLNIPVTILPNTQFLAGQFEPLPNLKPDQNIRQEQFYRSMRQHFDILMDENDQPAGGKWNYDKKNRDPLPQNLKTPEPIHFQPDSLTQEVIQEVSDLYQPTGNTDGFDLAVTHKQAQQAADDFFRHRLPNFGTFEDAMSEENAILFHSKLSPYLNIGLLAPLELIQEAEKYYYNGSAALNNVEGFIRQVVGWREYMFWQYRRKMPELYEGNYFQASNPLPSFFWHGKSDMNCLKSVIKRVLRQGYAHHIERLMVLSNFCVLAGINPHKVFEWFCSTFIDAYEWVMVPNVYGMGLYADGGIVGTKPYIASANYIHKMSDYCRNCSYDHNKRTGQNACPYNFLYWHFLLKNESVLRDNPRMGRMLYNLKYLDQDERSRVIKQSDQFLTAET